MKEKTRTIRRYYDQNTRLFLSVGSSPDTHSIHRAVWGEQVKSPDGALNYTNDLILGEVNNLSQVLNPERFQIVDLGCGVGGSLYYLLEHLEIPTIGIGLTISPVQARLARQQGLARNLQHLWLILVADFLAVPLAKAVQVAYSVEAFVHAADPITYFTQAVGILRPGGRLILCDDFLNERKPTEEYDETAQRWLQTYREGWQAINLCTTELVKEIARTHDLRLVREENLTPYLRLRALPNWLARFLLSIGKALPVRHAILSSMLGSMALQQCLQMGIIQYRYLVFEKADG